MVNYIEHKVYASIEDFYENKNEFVLYSLKERFELKLRSFIYINKELTITNKSGFVCDGVEYKVGTYGHIVSMALIPRKLTIPQPISASTPKIKKEEPIKFHSKCIEIIPNHLKARNANSHYEDSSDGRASIKRDLSLKIDAIASIPNDKINTGKNLLYYSIFDNANGYSELLRISLLSIKKYEPLNFDLLFITDEITKSILDTLLNEIQLVGQFLIVKTPNNGIEASKTKTQIFEFKNINNYENILFLDCDTLIVGNINTLFDIAKRYEILYTAFNSNLTLNMHGKSLYHGLQSFDDAEVDKIIKHNQMPFNAGQFMFKNSQHMRCHFDNLNWFMENWPGVYFFEQSFMNHYFCNNLMTEWQDFNDKFHLPMQSRSDRHNSSVIVVHFIGPALELTTKLKHIENYKKVNTT